MTKLQQIRREAKITQAQLAELSSVNVRLIQDYEQGRKAINGAAAATVYRIANALGVTVGDLLEPDA